MYIYRERDGVGGVYEDDYGEQRGISAGFIAEIYGLLKS